MRVQTHTEYGSTSNLKSRAWSIGRCKYWMHYASPLLWARFGIRSRCWDEHRTASRTTDVGTEYPGVR